MSEVPFFSSGFASSHGLLRSEDLELPPDAPRSARDHLGRFPGEFYKGDLVLAPCTSLDGTAGWVAFGTFDGVPKDSMPAAVVTHLEHLDASEDVYLCYRYSDALALEDAGLRSMYANIAGRDHLAERFKVSPPACKVVMVPPCAESERTDEDERDYEGLRERLAASGADVDGTGWPDDLPYYALARGGLDAVRNFARNASTGISMDLPQYCRSPVSDSCAAFMESIDAEQPEAVKTGIAELDRLLGGGFRSGLVVLGAASSLGKTTLAVQMADAAARQGVHVLFFTGEQSARELYAKSVARLTNEGDGVPRTASDILYRFSAMPPADADYVMSKVAEHAERSRTLWMIESHASPERITGDPRIGPDTVEDEVARLRRTIGPKTPLLVVVDYLQLLYVEPLVSETGRIVVPDRRLQIDEILTTMRRLTKDTNTTVMLISSKSREAAEHPTDMGGMKESGGIEYTADLVLDLVPDVAPPEGRGREKWSSNRAVRDLDDRPMRLNVLKNRMGELGGVLLQYHARYDHFEAREKPIPETLRGRYDFPDGDDEEPRRYD